MTRKKIFNNLFLYIFESTILKDLTAFDQVENPINGFFIPNFSHLKSKLLAFMFQRHDLAYIVENLSKKKTNQALFDYVGKNTKYIVICAAADWTKYSSVIIFVNFLIRRKPSANS